MNPGKILVADDDAKLAELLALNLKKEGFEVICARDGYQALEAARKHEPDVLLLDINMPAGDGFSVQERVGRMTDLSKTPVVYLTGDKTKWVETHAKEVGAFALIHKPFEFEDLIKTMTAAVEHSRELAKKQADAA